jgi:hypothetical protein
MSLYIEAAAGLISAAHPRRAAERGHRSTTRSPDPPAPAASTLAVRRLITSSNVVGCWMGNAVGVAPLRILSTGPPEQVRYPLVPSSEDLTRHNQPIKFATTINQSNSRRGCRVTRTGILSAPRPNELVKPSPCYLVRSGRPQRRRRRPEGGESAPQPREMQTIQEPRTQLGSRPNPETSRSPSQRLKPLCATPRLQTSLPLTTQIECRCELGIRSELLPAAGTAFALGLGAGCGERDSLHPERTTIPS